MLLSEGDPGVPDGGVKVTAHLRVHAALRRGLMNGDFVPGQRLVVREVAEAYETSAMPVREALRQLVSDGALFDHPNRGVIVPEATVEVISDVSRIRCLIEGAAAEWAATTITDEELRQLEEIDGKMRRSAAGGNSADYLVLNRDFHFSVYRAARSEVLQSTIERLWLRAGPWLNIMREDATLGLGMDHHSDVIAALRRGDGRGARRALVADISDAADVMQRAASGRRPVAPAGRERGRRKVVQA
jgi:DNA-binding GntR family transcriptional regulator